MFGRDELNPRAKTARTHHSCCAQRLDRAIQGLLDPAAETFDARWAGVGLGKQPTTSTL
jgi:hypothetical protein